MSDKSTPRAAAAAPTVPATEASRTASGTTVAVVPGTVLVRLPGIRADYESHRKRLTTKSAAAGG